MTRVSFYGTADASAGVFHQGLVWVLNDVYGAEVNVASKLGEDTAKAGDILVSEGFYQSVSPRKEENWKKLDVEIPGTSGAWKYVY